MTLPIERNRSRAAVDASLALGVATVVIAAAPSVGGDPNALAGPPALVVAVGCAGALTRGRWGRRVASAVSGLGLALSALWLWLASDGFGKGTPWWDDLAEAAILAVAFGVALILLWRARRATSAVADRAVAPHR